MGRHRFLIGRTSLAAMAAASLLAAGCATEAQGSLAETVDTIRIGAPISEPKWSEGALYGLVEETSQVARIEPGKPPDANTRLSEPLEEAGENLVVPSDVRDAVYLPQPGMDRVLQLDARDLQTVRSFPAGASPAYLAVDEGSQMLLARSEDGATVTAVGLRSFGAQQPVQVRAGKRAELDGPARGRLVDFYVAGPHGIEHYKGAPGGVERKGRLAISTHTSAGDETKVSRLYVGEEGTGRLLAVEVRRGHDGLTVSAATELGEPIEHIGVDSYRIYVATEHKLAVFEADSFEGYGDDASFSPVATIDFRRALPTEELKAAKLSGLAVGEGNVYLSLRDQPYLVSIKKPEI